ncbi:hypothetical protein Sjap_008137 [Stephania japonica]|uniref:Uncharacterized protein n=1 Tax=Stephania japonica TaxID=461633 RepID=A0AAP0PAK5_9MAGN
MTRLTWQQAIGGEDRRDVLRGAELDTWRDPIRRSWNRAFFGPTRSDDVAAATRRAKSREYHRSSGDSVDAHLEADRRAGERRWSCCPRGGRRLVMTVFGRRRGGHQAVV